MAEQSWTDDPITAGNDRIRKKSVHFTELQGAINAWESAYGIANTSWNQSPAKGVKIDDEAIDEMQEAINDLIALVSGAGFTAFGTVDKGDKIKPKDINDLRTNMNKLQDEYCYLCDTCDTYIGCTCDNTCNNDSCDLCNAVKWGSCTGCVSSCYGYICTCNYTCYSEGCKSSDACNCHNTCYGYGYTCNPCYQDICICNPACYGDSCDQCDASCYGEGCNKCDGVNYRYPWT